MSRKRNLSGFTLVEIAIVLAIVGVLIGAAFLGGNALIVSADKKAAIAQVGELRGAIAQFQAQFKFLPGDFPAGNEIAALLARCQAGGATGGNGNGIIGAEESTCVEDHLTKSSYIRAGAFTLKNGDVVRVISNPGAVARYAASTGGAATVSLRANILNVILLPNIACNVAIAIDEAFDDGDIAAPTGKIVSLDGACANRDTDRVWLEVALK